MTDLLWQVKQNMGSSSTDRLPEAELIGQMRYVSRLSVKRFSSSSIPNSTLIFTATDTTSSALARVMHLLSIHPEKQERLRQEILDCASDGDIGHDDLTSLPYLDAICRETLRL